jgi:putative membrane protein
MVLIGLYAAAVGFLEIEYWKLPDNSHVKTSIMHGMLGFVISLLLVLERILLMIAGGRT